MSATRIARTKADPSREKTAQTPFARSGVSRSPSSSRSWPERKAKWTSPSWSRRARSATRRQHPKAPKCAVAFLGAALVALCLSACIPTPVAHTVVVYGDSIAYLSWYPSSSGVAGCPPGDQCTVHATIFFHFQDWQSQATSDAQAGNGSVVVIALGQNNAVDGDGWTQGDDQALTTLATTPSTAACEVVVLPGDGAMADPARTAVVQQAHDAMILDVAALRAKGRRLVTVDWSVWTAQYGDATNMPDGVHPATNGVDINGAAQTAYRDLIWSGVSQCEAPS